MTLAKQRIGILIGAAWPDNDASGPVQSVRHIAQALSDRFEFHFFARNGAPGEAPKVAHGTTKDGPAGCWHYLDVLKTGARDLGPRITRVGCHIVWANSVWDREFTLPMLLARATGRIDRMPVLLSTRGEMSREALAIHPIRKRAMRFVMRHTNILQGVTLHSTGPIETSDVKRVFPKNEVFEAGNIRALPSLPPRKLSPTGALNLLFLGRISPVKGLDNALEAMGKLTSRAHLDIYGPEHDTGYWKHCCDLIERLPAHCTATWHGPVSNSSAAAIYAASDLFLNLSASENFGHTIFEALAAGTPVVTGTRTPWNGLEGDRAGFNRESDNAEAVATAIEAFAGFSPDLRNLWRDAARARAERFVTEQTDLIRWRDWFTQAAFTPRGP